jgi:hypothetical protein
MSGPYGMTQCDTCDQYLESVCSDCGLCMDCGDCEADNESKL